MTIDPLTNQVTTNALQGFLPPNVNSPEGQGYVSYTVRANQARQTGDVFENRASIVFDYNPPIPASWHNTIDVADPSCTMTSLTAVNDTTLVATCLATDVGSGPRQYIWYGSTNGRPDYVTLGRTSQPTITLPCFRDSTYCVRAVAVDSADNHSLPSADVCLRVTGLGAESFAKIGCSLFPNPTTGRVTLELSENASNAAGGLKLVRVFDATGRLVQQIAGEGRKRVDVQLPPVAGVYQVQVQLSDGTTASRRLVVVL